MRIINEDYGADDYNSHGSESDHDNNDGGDDYKSHVSDHDNDNGGGDYDLYIIGRFCLSVCHEK